MQTESIPYLASHLKEGQRIGQPRFIFLIGAGSSRTSGIPIASWMIGDFKRKLNEIWVGEGRPNDFDSWIQTRPGWKKNENENDYAKYFEAWSPTEGTRRDYLNYWMKGGSPSWRRGLTPHGQCLGVSFD